MQITLVDTFGFLFRAYFALPPLKSKAGHPTGLLTGFINFVTTLTKEHSNDKLIFCLDSKTPSFRSTLYPQYKAHRPEVPEELKLQLPIAIAWIEKMGFATAMVEGWEADDVIASLTACAINDGKTVTIASHDKDLYQLIDDGRVKLWDPIKKTPITSEGCFEKYGVTPAQFTDYQALIGDSADNIPGAKGIGPKTASKLIDQFGTLQAIYENIETITPNGVKEKLLVSHDDVMISRKLVELSLSCITSYEWERGIIPQNPLVKISDELMHFNMERVLGKTAPSSYAKASVMPLEKKRENTPFKAITLLTYEELKSVITSIPDNAIVAFDTETDDLDTKKATMVGFSFSWEEGAGYYVPLRHAYLGAPEQINSSDAQKGLKLLLSHPLVGHNLKFDLGVLNHFDPNLSPILHADTMIMAWLANAGSLVGLDACAQTYLNHEMISFSSTVKKGESFDRVEIEQATAYAAEDSVITLRLYHVLYEKLSSQTGASPLEEMRDVELPFIKTLLSIEQLGITLDPVAFKSLGDHLTSTLAQLTQKIHHCANSEFNINSPSQLGVILFEHLGLKGSKKTKTGYSTDEKVLSSLENDHPIIPLLLEYRELFKLKSTYIDPLLTLALGREDHKIFTSFLQTGTATGRLSSRNPNLQNIPVRGNWGQEVRNGFIASQGNTFIGIDYSQIELRLLAHFSKDPTLIAAFQAGADIHYETALKLFGEDEAKNKRHIAKTVNFGILYGMGSRKLSEDLGIPSKEAKEIIENYFASFPTIKEYIATVHSNAQNNGFVQTLLGRRRYFDFAKANGMQQAMYLRESVNTIFQGSASDLIKVAMNKIYDAIHTQNLPLKIVLQIHDELILETPLEKANEMSKIVQEIMEKVIDLDVPLTTSIAIANRWGELK